MVTRHVVIKLNVLRPIDSTIHPTNAGGVGDGLGLQFEQAVAFIMAFIVAFIVASVAAVSAL
jgi:hypothetical protein